MPIPIFDGHNDILLRLFKRGGDDAAQSFVAGESKGQLDLPMARAGGFAGGLFAIFVPSSSGGGATRPADGDAPTVGLEAAQMVAIAMAALLLRIERESQGAVRMCRSVGDIESSFKANALAAVLHLEGCEPIDEDFAFLDVLHGVGLRSLGPVWSRSNLFGHGVPFRFPSSPDIGPGLTDLGKALVRRCDQLRILVDLSHLNEKGFWDVAEISGAPLVATHSNAHAVCQHSRNLTDEQLAAIRKSGGLAGVNFGVSFLRADGQANADTPLEQVVAHIDYLLEHLGEDGVGLGSDFDGARIPAALGTAAGLPKLVEAMAARGYSQALIEKICFRNWLSVLRRTWER